ncbi:MAG: hypothetical protein IPF46_01660 [Saprospiraceae bacterium]|nr:hypothetical protein [Candidatus Vicinibacter affinis]MBK6572846.1 hypothetical protein [Candidatus Vicinibacter affinis]MBK6824697.1 hypothetical protein [Candidatus Vicinibacter affinis]MBK7798572.1 hypothetical protein [Candidatus Vicinibacter affinis]
MNTDFTNKLSLNEILRIFIPGLYLTMMMDILFSQDFITRYNFEIEDSYKTIIFIIICVLTGLTISSLDIPKLYFFNNKIPINQLKKDLPKIDKVENINLYFQFYDKNISFEFKNKTELNNGYYLLCANLSIISFLITTISLIIYQKLNGIIILNLIIFLLSLIASIALFRNKVLENFNRQTNLFRNSEEYKQIKSQL